MSATDDVRQLSILDTTERRTLSGTLIGSGCDWTASLRHAFCPLERRTPPESRWAQSHYPRSPATQRQLPPKGTSVVRFVRTSRKLVVPDSLRLELFSA